MLAPGRRRLPQHHRAAPPGASRALLPDARLAARCRGCAPEHPSAGLAGATQVPGPKLASQLAVPDRDQRLPRRNRAPSQARAADRLRTAHKSGRRARQAAVGQCVDRAVPGRNARQRGWGRDARGSLRAPRDAGARPNSCTAAPQRPPAGRAHPPRRARLLRQGGCGLARDHGRIGQRGDPPRSPGAGGAGAGAKPACELAEARRPAAPRDRGALCRCLRAGRGRRDPRPAGRGRER